MVHMKDSVTVHVLVFVTTEPEFSFGRLLYELKNREKDVPSDATVKFYPQEFNEQLFTICRITWYT